MKKKNNKKTRFVMYSGWQTLLELIAILSVILFVSSIESNWSKDYFIFVGILITAFVVSTTLIHKFGK